MNKSEFIKRRQKISEQMKNNEVVILFAGHAPRKSADETYEFTPNRNFYYLTGDDEENDILLITKFNNKVSEVLFVARYDEYVAKWFGETYSKEEASKMSGINSIMNLDEFEGMIGILATTNTLYLDLERQSFNEEFSVAQEFARKVKEKYPAIEIANIYNAICSLRMAKSEAELEEIRHAIAITNKAFLNLLDHAKESIGKKESYLEAYFDLTIKQEGASDFAFDTIAAGGKNACVLHYRANNSELKDGDLVLFDMGAEYNYYKSDITRTFPLNGKFSDKQKKIYEIVLEGQKVIERKARAGLSCADLNQELIKYYIPELKKLGLIHTDEEYFKYYFHGCSHPIGLDTHDAMVRTLPLPVGAVISNEPGLYIPEWNIGIRIEDDLLIKEDGCEVLSRDIIKTVKDIEDYMNK